MIKLQTCVMAMSLLVCSAAIAQNSTSSAPSSTYSQADVPTGTAIPGDYSGAYRPQVHFSPPKGFMNDPNGMFLGPDGVYHLYYQYNPTANVAGNQHWGHATSRDLYSWTNQPIAIFPGGPKEGIFSGSAIVDFNNTSGFFPNQTDGVVAIYTLNTPQEQTQDIAYSRDGGYTFTKYENNPVISINSTQFRDPKVIWHAPTSRWVMVVAYAQEYTIGFFSSTNLVEWRHDSNFSHHGLLGLQYECPNLVRLPFLRNASEPFSEDNTADVDSYILLLSINPGAPLGGSISEYFPGTFNGTHFTTFDAAARITDFAKDNYAGQFFENLDPRAPQISIAWASNWQYTNVVPTDSEGFRSVMTVPRMHVLANTTRNPYALISAPYNLSAAYASNEPVAASQDLANSSLLVNIADEVPSRAFTFTMNATGLPTGAAGTLNFTLLSSTTGETLRGGFILSGDTVFWLDRGKTWGFENEFFVDKFSVAHVVDPETGAFSMTVIVDRSIIEVFLDGGVKSGTSIFFAEGELDILILAVGGLSEGATASAAIWGLESGWSNNGTYSGGKNATQVAMRRWDGGMDPYVLQ